ncbi:hypothetical protein QA612_16755 [Evansella sp. AB-P1]|nr:hypothetical protein [Evansella sp. AB-P1]MDG5789109.1 hypothetical protein [Evansella sp. AB-P1]
MKLLKKRVNSEKTGDRAEVVQQLKKAKKQGKAFITDKGERLLKKWS